MFEDSSFFILHFYLHRFTQISLDDFGIALDLRSDRLYYTSLGGVVGSVALDGSHARTLLTEQGALTGIAALEH